MFGAFKPNKPSGALGSFEKAMTKTSRQRFARPSRFDWRFILRALVVALGLAVLGIGCWGVLR